MSNQQDLNIPAATIFAKYPDGSVEITHNGGCLTLKKDEIPQVIAWLTNLDQWETEVLSQPLVDLS